MSEKSDTSLFLCPDFNLQSGDDTVNVEGDEDSCIGIEGLEEPYNDGDIMLLAITIPER